MLSTEWFCSVFFVDWLIFSSICYSIEIHNYDCIGALMVDFKHFYFLKLSSELTFKYTVNSSTFVLDLFPVLVHILTLKEKCKWSWMLLNLLSSWRSMSIWSDGMSRCVCFFRRWSWTNDWTFTYGRFEWSR